MQKKKRNLFYAEEGVMALEACISLTLFLIAMMALYSLINMFTAQSMISHALQQMQHRLLPIMMVGKEEELITP